jgi:hypothetical protein
MRPADHHRPWLVGGVVLLGGLTCGCREPAPQVEFANLRHSAALRTAANTRSAERLERAVAAIDAERAAGRMPAEEHSAYAAIIAMARAGDWEGAERAAVRFRRDQTRVDAPASITSPESPP